MSDCSANTLNNPKQRQSGQDAVTEDNPEAQKLYQESPFIYVPTRSKKNKGRRGKPVCAYGEPDKGRLEDDRLPNRQVESDSCFPSTPNVLCARSSAEFTYVERNKSMVAWLKKSLTQSHAPSRILRVRCLALGPFSPDNLEHLSENATSDKQAATIPSNMLRGSQYQLIFFLDVILPTLKAHNVAAQSVGESPSPSGPKGARHDIEIQVSFYDPAFRQSDKAYLRGLGHDVHDKEQDLMCDEHTFFYIPHGPLSLYAALLQANHGSKHPGRLGNLVLFGNELTNYLDLANRGKKDSSFTSISDILENNEIVSNYPPEELTTQGGTTVFNSMCLQWFRTNNPGTNKGTETDR
ncbi:uncharacterized protein MELLADRAFT_110593 [Melampsora larici-populina 98AG31]|uniref:SRR1-like domain-containing protein n=1 Tax=Melampsora larici-populina (strain 98AG31 / pathotype 3-4-7) TaxID=747676 RepID=F4S0B4_MELLP|nr:uncharacterized protein MELLADRAFT_110593 [Melampsora larici-populina 98AG31]EGG01933.1 hypothetical protein MELLADRAFT_110593 [Melampsora larici-populina 98AG31]